MLYLTGGRSNRPQQTILSNIVGYSNFKYIVDQQVPTEHKQDTKYGGRQPDHQIAVIRHDWIRRNTHSVISACIIRVSSDTTDKLWNALLCHVVVPHYHIGLINTTADTLPGNGIHQILIFFNKRFRNNNRFWFFIWRVINTGYDHIKMVKLSLILEFNRNFCTDFFFNIQILQYVGRYQHLICFLWCGARMRCQKPKFQLVLIGIINLCNTSVGVSHDLYGYPAAYFFKHRVLF